MTFLVANVLEGSYYDFDFTFEGDFMVREIHDTELDDLLKLYLDLHEDTVPEMTEHLKTTWKL